LFRPASSGSLLPIEPEAGRIWLGYLGEGAADQVVLTVKTLQPEVHLEIHCHGGREVLRYLGEGLAVLGLSECSWQAFLAWGGTPGLHREAERLLPYAPTLRTANILLDQAAGAFDRALHQLQELWDSDAYSAGQLLEALARRTSLGSHLTIPWRVVVAGAPNVGKSSLVNALAGYQRSIVAPTPGTTRDLVTTQLAVDGWPIELVDTAGLREGETHLEQLGTELARNAMARADLCLWILDASSAPVWPPFQGETCRLVVNKIDCPAAWDLREAPQAPLVSAKSGAGLEALCQALSDWLVPDPPTSGDAVPFTEGHGTAIALAWRQLQQGDISKARLLLQSMTHPVNPF
jgi:tRNA modification GTPase